MKFDKVTKNGRSKIELSAALKKKILLEYEKNKQGKTKYSQRQAVVDLENFIGYKMSASIFSDMLKNFDRITLSDDKAEQYRER